MDIHSDVKKRSDPRYLQVSHFERLAIERDDQPEAAMKSKDFYDALKTQGVKVTNVHQVGAFIVGAGYCDKADADPDIDLTVCEFDDDAKMAKGVNTMTTMFKLPNRVIVQHKHSTVAVNRLGESKDSIDMAKKIVAAAKAF
jgi:hypothetical protein